jgi:hypothetical protein
MLIYHMDKTMGASMSGVKDIQFIDTDSGPVMVITDNIGNYIKVLMPFPMSDVSPQKGPTLPVNKPQLRVVENV